MPNDKIEYLLVLHPTEDSRSEKEQAYEQLRYTKILKSDVSLAREDRIAFTDVNDLLVLFIVKSVTVTGDEDIPTILGIQVSPQQGKCHISDDCTVNAFRALMDEFKFKHAPVECVVTHYENEQAEIARLTAEEAQEPDNHAE